MRPLRLLLSTVTLMTVIAFASGCAHGRKLLIVEESQSVFRLAEDTEAPVFFKNEKGEWERARNEVTLKAGWYVGSLQ